MKDVRDVLGIESPDAAQAVADDIIVDRKMPVQYAAIPLVLLTRRDLSAGAKVAICAIQFCQQRGDVKGDLADVVASLVGISRERAFKHLRELESAKVLKRRSVESEEKAS